MSDRALEGIQILVTRTALDASVIGDPLQQLGAEVSYLPMLEIVPIDPTPKQLATLSKFEPGEQIIFVSRNAVRFSVPYLSQKISCWPQTAQLFAVGEGTADLLSSLTGQSVIYPQRQQTSEGLLALKQLHGVAGQQIWLMQGEGGREMLEQTLTRRAARLISIAWYRRQASQEAAESLERLLKIKRFDVILLSSLGSLKRFAQLVRALPAAALSKANLLVVSPRIAQQALNLLPDAKIICAQGAGQQAVTQALLQWVHKKNI